MTRVSGLLAPTYWRRLWDLSIATLVATMAWQYRDESWLHVLFGFAMATLLVWRRHRPVPVLLGIAALALVRIGPVRHLPVAEET